MAMFDTQSAYDKFGADPKAAVKCILKRYTEQNPEGDFPAAVQLPGTPTENRNSRFVFDFDEMYPESKIGDYAYLCSAVFAEKDYVKPVLFNLKKFIKIYLNGELVDYTRFTDEIQGNDRYIDLKFKKGANVIFIKCRKTVLGFGCTIGMHSHFSEAPMYFSPFDGEKRMLGWRYTKPFCKDAAKPFVYGEKTDVDWLPEYEYDNSFRSVFKGEKGVCYGAAEVELESDTSYSFGGVKRVYIDGSAAAESGKIASGRHFVAFEADSCADVLTDIETEWRYIGALSEPDERFLMPRGIYSIGKTADGYTYWRVSKNLFLRMYTEGHAFGNWSYPLGVALYGIMVSSDYLGLSDTYAYADRHMQNVADAYEYSLYDRDRYGLPFVDRQPAKLEVLDACGSFASSVLEWASRFKNPKVAPIAKNVAEFMKNVQARLENGMFYRISKGTSHENTIWCDDLYMSVPFMCRYYKYSGDESFLDDAVHQQKCFFEKLYMPEKGLMSHVYSLNYGTMTGIPWGRGNGWALFSLSELLTVMPKEHKDYGEILKIFNTLLKGVMKYQDADGMWHQVVDEPDSYAETSCTAMFTSCLARAVNNGWTDEKGKCSAAAKKGFEALMKYCIDADGNLYGVCKGSCFAFNSDYYKYDLPWVKNDMHGSGIVLIAATEVLKLPSA